MAAIPIFIIGADTLLLYDLLPIIRFAIKYSNFKSIMMISLLKNTLLLCLLIGFSCNGAFNKDKDSESGSIIQMESQDDKIVEGAARLSEYLPVLKGRIGIVANQTSVIYHSGGQKYTHLVDTLLARNVDVVRVFAPEHGFRGTADAGEIVRDGMDIKTGLPIISLYGENKKPAFDDHDLDRVIFDIQDVGARFYTYISSLHYVMEACAEQNIPLIVLDRPNPNGFILDGPILNMEHSSFVGMHPVPVLHGMTIGEYARMINGEGWLKGGIQCELEIVKMENYKHSMRYHLSIKPSPNLPNDKAINLYPSLCFFEGTNVSAGRGTELQFQIFGSPYLDPAYFKYQFTPVPNQGAKYPKHENKLCYGMNLAEASDLKRIDLSWLVEAYHGTNDKSDFFNSFFIKLAGTDELRAQIESGYTAEEIRKSWRPGIADFKKKRQPYLIYD
ncbi:MAG: DUF1343 domain-containing protein [Bacteroidia bacterium]|nr:DUF1343 domain-containing protein [Bacteroidia bacterium]MBT8269794.1 DUF1343 domain-containing protein [Bacteroidia bacterium]NNL80411.1 DUF1343 domain-containing protein [Flavobacteriaceae bacterium]